MRFFKMISLFVSSILISNIISAQIPAIIHEGEIEFEKRVNAYALFNEYPFDKQYIQEYKESKPQLE